MNFADQLRLLQAAQGDPSKLALATVDLAYPSLSNAELTALRESLEAAAIPHWCDDSILSALLGIPPDESTAHLARLRALKVVEPFPARGTSAVNVHESARLAIRKGMAAQAQERFRKFSARAAAHFAPDLTPSGRIEWIFHLLCGGPERGATELEKLDREWGSSARPEDRNALAAALGELESDGFVQGRARVWTLLSMAWIRVSRAESAELAPLAEEILHLAQAVVDLGAEADAQCLRGDVLEAQGKLTEARSAFSESLRISRRLAEQDPGNAGWQRELAVVHSRVGDVFEAQDNLAEAQTAFGEYLRISRGLAEQDPGNAGWQRELAVAHSRVGGVLQAQGNLAEAQSAFGQCLRISLLLAKQDPGNAGWQRELAVAHNRVGEVLEAQGNLAEAQSAFEECLRISRRLAEQDPGNATWQRDLGLARRRLGGVLQAQDNLAEAQVAYAEDLRISRRLAEQDPGNPRWQRDLALAHSRVGGLLEAQGNLAEAQAAYAEDLRISRRLAEQDPGNVVWQRGLAEAWVRIARLDSSAGRQAEALPRYEEAARIYASLAELAPWAKDEQFEEELVLCRLRVAAIPPR